MGRPIGSQPPSPEAAELIATLKVNIRRRLDVLGITPSIVGARTGRGYSWLHDVVTGERYGQKVSLNLVAEIAKALGVIPYRLLKPDYDGSGITPAWYVENPPLRPRGEEATP